ncbi:arylsulfatase [Neorhodopirellula pilleata]|uniref:Arylsulfatase n=1 Tax=Neorhodopirellula pilleata TaxID=2714738 RepID=A0A5C5ZZM2_9BACT|nr:arylsulfatase [Neorhodopirellula pilleata]TWT92507.1 Arylsulfatase [Neorhodopirellula pilleata]
MRLFLFSLPKNTLIIAIFSVWLLAWLPTPPAGAAQPNIVLVVADDLGYSDLGCYGGEIATPNLDRLANDGVRLTRFFNGGMCVTTRASLMTGQWWPVALRDFNSTDTLPERLKTTGYQTALIGKWHLPGHPMDHGFDHFFGFLNGFADHFAGNNQYQLDRNPFHDFATDFYSSDALTDRAIHFIEQADANQPFMVMVSYQAPHNPLQAPREEIEKYRGKYRVGWHAIREARFEQQKQIGLVASNAQLPAYPDNLPQWDSLTEAQQDLEDLRMAVYAAMVDRMDQGIGRLLRTLDSKSIAENTLVLFISDNGTDSFSVVDQPMLAQGKLPGDRGSNWQPGTGWAYASVTPWRMYKISQHAGGVTSGAIARWPAKIQPGQIRSQAVHVVDVLPTLTRLALTDSVARAEENANLSGQSFVDLLTTGDWQRDRPLYFQYMDNRAVRDGDWTLAEVDESGWELFQSTIDPLETNDLSDLHPEKVDELAKGWLKWWRMTSQEDTYQPTTTQDSPHYSPQGDRGSGQRYHPSAMPPTLGSK